MIGVILLALAALSAGVATFALSYAAICWTVDRLRIRRARRRIWLRLQAQIAREQSERFRKASALWGEQVTPWAFGSAPRVAALVCATCRRKRRVHGRTKCVDCAERSNRSTRAVYGRRAEAGLCVRCGVDSDGAKRCAACVAIELESRSAK